MLRNDARSANSANRRGLVSPKPYYRISRSGMRHKNIKFVKKKKTKKVEDFRRVFGFKNRMFHDTLGLYRMWRARLGLRSSFFILYQSINLVLLGYISLSAYLLQYWMVILSPLITVTGNKAYITLFDV